MMSRKNLIMAVGLGGLVLVALVWAFGYMASCRGRALEARGNLLDCRQASMQIGRYSRRPAMAAEHELQSSETTALIERAAMAAGVPRQRLTNITPEPPQRLGDSAYKEKPTGVRVDGVSLQQLIGMIYNLVSVEKPLSPKSLRIVAPREADLVGTWTAELTLTYLIYDPAKGKE